MSSVALAQEKFPSQVGGRLLFLNYGWTNETNDPLRLTNGFELFLNRGLTKQVNVNVPLRLGIQHTPEKINNQSFIGADATIQFLLKDRNSSWIPYGLVGAGVVVESFESTNVQFPIGAGVNLKVANGSYLNVQAEYRYGVKENRTHVQLGIGYSYQLGQKSMDRDKDGVPDEIDACPDQPGPAYLSGCPDLDGDGIADNADACPTVAGLPQFAGCPDTDGDGIPNDEDKCPTQAGSPETKGCPDIDGDGIIDSEDECPDDFGRVRGCPDRDKDGVPDKDDACPDEPGSLSTNGCPAIDTDGDGVPDYEDLCPDEAGSIAARGCPDADGDGFSDRDDLCPEIAGTFDGCPDTDSDGIHDGIDECPYLPGIPERAGCPDAAAATTENYLIPETSSNSNMASKDKKFLEEAAQNIQFEVGSSVLKASSYDLLREVKNILQRYPNSRLVIEGHTDNVGNATKNLQLSTNRARACYEYLIASGVLEERLSYKGYGASQPVETNNTAEGRAKNRRVEFTLN